MPTPIFRPEDTEEEIYTVKIWRDTNTGVVVVEDWQKGVAPHRKDGPSRIERDRVTGIVTLESWNVNGVNHRLDGPAVTCRNPKTGRVTYSAWYQDGEKIAPPKRPAKRAKGPLQQPRQP